MSANTPYTAFLQSLGDRDAVPSPLHSFQLYELRPGGWLARASLILAHGGQDVRPPNVVQAFNDATLGGLLPGRAVALRLVPRDQPGEVDEPRRSWPSMISKVESRLERDDGNSTWYTVCDIHLCDPLNYLARRRIWGAYRNCSPGEMLGGALSLAAGGTGVPTLAPVLPDMPRIRIDQSMHESLQVPYALAFGETLEHWLREVFGRLGIRFEFPAANGDEVAIDLYDKRPTRTMPFTFGAGDSTETNAVLTTLRMNAVAPRRGALLDNRAAGSFARLGTSGPVETVIDAARIGPEDGKVRSVFASQTRTLRGIVARISTRQPALTPGCILEFDRPVWDADRWQSGSVNHIFTRGRYLNIVKLKSEGIPWRPPISPDLGSMIVSGVVDDGVSTPGTAVVRDSLGQIPVRFSFLPSVSPDNQISARMADWPPRIFLPVLESMAGGVHGFVSSHRQNDMCRVSIRNPLSAEILGFCYSDDRRLSADLADISTGVVLRHGNQDWSGVLFRPKEDMMSGPAEDGSGL